MHSGKTHVTEIGKYGEKYSGLKVEGGQRCQQVTGSFVMEKERNVFCITAWVTFMAICSRKTQNHNDEML
jgi:hypothetical protein